MNENGGGSFFLGFLVGVMAGAAVALLLTPQSGEELRRTLEQKGGELKDGASRMAEDAKGQVVHVQEQGRIIVSDTVRKAQTQLQGTGGAPAADAV